MTKTRTRNLAQLGPVELAGALEDDQLDILAEAYRRWHLTGITKVPSLWILFYGRRRHDYRRLEAAGLIRHVGSVRLCKERRHRFSVTSQGMMILLEFQRNGINAEHVSLPTSAVPGDGYHHAMRARLRLALRNYKMDDLAKLSLRVPLGPGGNSQVHIEHDFRKFVAEGLEQCHHQLFPLIAEGMRATRGALYWLRKNFLATMDLVLEDVAVRRREGTLPATKFEDYQGDQAQGSVTVAPGDWTEAAGLDLDEAGVTFRWRYDRLDPPDDPEDHTDRGVLLVALDWHDDAANAHDDEHYWLGLDAIWTKHDRLVAWRVLREAEELIEVLPRNEDTDLDGDPFPSWYREPPIARSRGDDEEPRCGIAIIDDCRFEDPLPDVDFDPNDRVGRWLARLLRTAAALVPRNMAERPRVVRQVRLAGLAAVSKVLWGGAEICGWKERHDERDPDWTWEWDVWDRKANADLSGLVELGAPMMRWQLLCREQAFDNDRVQQGDVECRHLEGDRERLAKLVDRCRHIASDVELGRGVLPVVCPMRYAKAGALLHAYANGWIDRQRIPLRADTDAAGRYVRVYAYDAEDDYVVFDMDYGVFRQVLQDTDGTYWDLAARLLAAGKIPAR